MDKQDKMVQTFYEAFEEAVNAKDEALLTEVIIQRLENVTGASHADFNAEGREFIKNIFLLGFYDGVNKADADARKGLTNLRGFKIVVEELGNGAGADEQAGDPKVKEAKA